MCFNIYFFFFVIRSNFISTRFFFFLLNVVARPLKKKKKKKKNCQLKKKWSHQREARHSHYEGKSKKKRNFLNHFSYFSKKKSRRVAASVQSAARQAAPPPPRSSDRQKKVIDVVIDDEFDRTEEESLRARLPRRRAAAAAAAPVIEDDAGTEVLDDSSDDEDESNIDINVNVNGRLAAASDEEEEDSAAVNATLFRSFQLLCADFANWLYFLDFKFFFAAERLWPHADADGAWERGPDARLRRHDGGRYRWLLLLLFLVLLWCSVAWWIGGTEALGALAWPAWLAWPALPAWPSAAESSTSPTSPPLSGDVSHKLDQLIAERAKLEPRLGSLDAKWSAKLQQLEQELARLRAENDKLLAARHTHQDTPDGRKVLSESEVRSLASAAKPSTTAAATTTNNNAPNTADVEAIVRRLQLSPEAVIEAGKEKLEFLVRAAIDAEALARKDVYVSRETFNNALEREREQLGASLNRAVADGRAEHAKHTDELGAIGKRLKALADADLSESALRAIVREMLTPIDTKTTAALDDATLARSAADEALRLARAVPATSAPVANSGAPGGVDEAAVRRLVEQYVFGDTVGLADWALNQAGAVVLPQTSAPFYTPISERTMADFLALRRAVAMPPEVALSPDNTVGNCYAFAGVQGRFAVRLAAPVHVSAISIDHVAASVSYDQSSAPRKFRVLGFEDAHASGKPIQLGEFEYTLAGGSSVVQTFAVARAAVPIRAVVLDIESNHGAKFTCLYRFRVHGARAK
jgi:hypothetical protein